MSNVVEKEKKNTSGFTPEIVKENMCHFMDNENLSIANMQMIAGTATVQAVYYWMKGERVPSIDAFYSICTAFCSKKVHIEDFLREDGIPLRVDKKNAKWTNLYCENSK